VYGGGTFTRCIISNNSAESGGGVYSGEYSSSTFTNCTISNNSASYNGGGICCAYYSPIFHNTIIAFSEGEGVYFDSTCEGQFEYCNIFGNSDGAFGGYIPDEIGQLVTTNINDDSCDIYFNIFLDPMFVDTAAGDYHLLAGSPCIDAGDPLFPLDSDSTITDIGAFYFHQSAIEPPDELLPTEHALYPNWPNPFNPTTTIRYDVKQTGRVRLTIFNLLGQQVTRLIDKQHLAGTYTISWHATDLPSGIYFYQMQTPGFVQTRKLILLK